MNPAESIILSIPNYILFFFFGIALALIREWTKSVWASVGFHLGYLEMSRFIIFPVEYDVPSIVNYQDTDAYFMGSFLIIAGMIIGGICLFILLIYIKQLKKRQK